MTMNAINRRQFLRGDFRGQHQVLRPPWALAEQMFLDTCTRCGKCVSACPQAILVQERDGYPYVDFLRGECDFCGACADSCTPRALSLMLDSHAPWNVKALITDGCFAKRGILCITCLEHCAAGAMRRQLTARSASPPEISVAACNGCGACYRSCPANAIALKRIDSTGFSESLSSAEVHA